MTCREIRQQLSAYLDGELSPEESRSVRAHVASCPACRAELESLRRTIEAVKDLPPVAAPHDLKQRILETVNAADSPSVTHAGTRHWRRLWPTAAAILLGVFFTWHYGIARRPHTRSSRGRPVALLDKTAERAGKAPATESSPPSVPAVEPSISSVVETDTLKRQADTTELHKPANVLPLTKAAAKKGAPGRAGPTDLEKETNGKAGRPEEKLFAAGAAPPPTTQPLAEAPTGLVGHAKQKVSLAFVNAPAWAIPSPHPPAARARVRALLQHHGWLEPPARRRTTRDEVAEAGKRRLKSTTPELVLHVTPKDRRRLLAALQEAHLQPRLPRDTLTADDRLAAKAPRDASADAKDAAREEMKFEYSRGGEGRKSLRQTTVRAAGGVLRLTLTFPRDTVTPAK